MPNQQTTLDHAFQALADPTRRAVIQQLAHGPSTVSDLAAPFDMAMPSFLQHLRVLEKGGLITTQKTGRVRTCKFRPEKLAEAQDWLAEQRKLWDDRLDRLESYIETLATPQTAPLSQKEKKQ